MNTHINSTISTLVATIEAATQMLRAAGVQVLAQVVSHGRPLLIVNRPPAGVTGTVRRRLVLADGRHDLTYYSVFDGIRIEWREITRPLRRVDLATLEVMGHA